MRNERLTNEEGRLRESVTLSEKRHGNNFEEEDESVECDLSSRRVQLENNEAAGNNS